MHDSDDTNKGAIPSWQQAQPPTEQETKDGLASDAPQPATLEQARKFLQEEDVQKASRERKVEFLKSKGITQEDVDKLLLEEDNTMPATPSQQNEVPRQAAQSAQPAQPTQPRAAPASAPASEDRTPVITYPEFLVQPERPPPLVTVNGFLNTVKVFSGLSAVIYGTSKYVLEPMVNQLTDARIEFHEAANSNLAKLVEKLEATVSEIPNAKKSEVPASQVQPREDDDNSSYDDPTELFHRDIGVQTSRPSSPVDYRNVIGGTNEPPPRPTAAERLGELVKSVQTVKEGYIKEAEDYDKTKAILDEFSREMNTLAYPQNDYVFGYNSYSGVSSNEPNDEIKQAKENIRRVKGVLLSTRSFPTGTVR